MDRVHTQVHSHSAQDPGPNVSAAEHAAMWHQFTRAATIGIVVVAAILALMGLFLV